MACLDSLGVGLDDEGVDDDDDEEGDVGEFAEEEGEAEFGIGCDSEDEDEVPGEVVGVEDDPGVAE